MKRWLPLVLTCLLLLWHPTVKRRRKHVTLSGASYHCEENTYLVTLAIMEAKGRWRTPPSMTSVSQIHLSLAHCPR